MKIVGKILFALSLSLSAPAFAQQGSQIGSGTVLGNASAARGPATQATLSAIIDRAISSTQGSMLYRNSTIWTALGPGTAGLPLLSGGASANLSYGILGPAAGGTGVNNGASTFTIGGNFSTVGAAALPVIAQGDLWYGSAAGVISAIAKTASAHQFICNTGASNNPAWCQPAIADVSGWGTGVATALGVNVGTAGSFVVNGGALGTPSSGTLTSATGLPLSTGITGFGTGIATALAVNVGTAGAPVINGGALGSPSSAGTIPAYTLGGSIAGGGNAISNISGFGIRDTSAAFDVTLGATSSATLTAGRALTIDMVNAARTSQARGEPHSRDRSWRRDRRA